ncbi:MAG TPA: HAD-IA family hydrolase, partial [Acidobacteriaceae bacterium]|nr:HAD-IA family hydrolase [Acidobacteriaceae bacterium]
MVVEVKGILFDMDGVLVSSIGSVERCWRRWAAHYGVPHPESVEVPHGVRAIDIMRQLKPGIDTVEGLRLIEDMEIEDVADLTVLPGVRELLGTLPPERWAIVTSATRRLLIGRLQAARLPMPELILSGDMVERGKPDPEPYRRGAALIHAQPSECLVVEDAPSGVRAGVGAGCTVLGVEGTHPPEELLEAGARWVVPTLE